METKLKKLLIGLTLVAAAAATTPALAQSNSGMWNNNQQVWTYPGDYTQSYAYMPTPALRQSKSGMWNNNQQVWTRSADYTQSYAYAPQGFFGIVSQPGVHGDRAPFIEYGKYIGQDPDPSVRLQLQRGSVAFQ
jgi:hypothetical protein